MSNQIPASSVVWLPSNIYPTAKIGERVSVGIFSEIGDGVVVGDDTRIGSGTFIPAGVTIGKNVFIGPKVCFTNDRYPPSPKERWEKTVVKDNASIGANVTILPGVTIGRNAMVGAGSVVTQNIPNSEIWAGNPAKRKGII